MFLPTEYNDWVLWLLWITDESCALPCRFCQTGCKSSMNAKVSKRSGLTVWAENGLFCPYHQRAMKASKAKKASMCSMQATVCSNCKARKRTVLVVKPAYAQGEQRYVLTIRPACKQSKQLKVLPISPVCTWSEQRWFKSQCQKQNVLVASLEEEWSNLIFFNLYFFVLPSWLSKAKTIYNRKKTMLCLYT